MGQIGLMAWLRQRDPGLMAVRRAVRVTTVACLGGSARSATDAVAVAYEQFAAELRHRQPTAAAPVVHAGRVDHR